MADAALARTFDGMWRDLLEIGRDPRSGGYNRHAWTSVDAELRAWFTQEATRRGLEVQADRNGNLWAWHGTPGPGAIVTGSHLDSVPGGGAYDGPLGIVSAFAALDVLPARGKAPFAIVCFSDEEGARFGMPCMGSRLLTGALDPDRARALRDAEGVTFAEAFTGVAADVGPDPSLINNIAAFVELHIEQGRGLVAHDAPVGVGSSIWPHGRWRLDFQGEANHAGTTRLADRDDPMLPFARAVLAARDSAVRHGALATIGKVQVEPNGSNAIPSLVSAWLDARAPRAEQVRGVVEDLRSGGVASLANESWTSEVAFDEGLRVRLGTVVGPDVPVLATGAGHDSGILASAGVPTAMLFVRNPSGVSHSPAEHAEQDDCHRGVHALAAALEELWT